MTMDWQTDPADAARPITLRLAACRMHENIARRNLRDAISYYTDGSYLRDNVSFEKLEPLVKRLAAIHDQAKTHLHAAKQDFDAELARRQKAGIPPTGMTEADIHAAGMRLAENLDLSAPTPLDEFLAGHRTVQPLFPADADEEEDDDQPARARKLGR